MQNPFKQAVKILILDFEDYDYLLWDLEVWWFYENNCDHYIDNEDFREKFPITHNFILLVYIISYVWILEWSSYLSKSIEQFSENKSEIDLKSIIEKNNWNILIEILSSYRLAVYSKEKSNWNIDLETPELIKAWNALIPILKYLYKNSNEFE